MPIAIDEPELESVIEEVSGSLPGCGSKRAATLAILKKAVSGGAGECVRWLQEAKETPSQNKTTAGASLPPAAAPSAT